MKSSFFGGDGTIKFQIPMSCMRSGFESIFRRMEQPLSEDWFEEEIPESERRTAQEIGDMKGNEPSESSEVNVEWSFEGADGTADGDGGERMQGTFSRATQDEERVDNGHGLLMEGRDDATRGEQSISTLQVNRHVDKLGEQWHVFSWMMIQCP